MHNDRLTPDNRGKFCYIAGQYGQQVEFHNVEEIAGSTLRKFEAAHPVASGINAWWYPLIVHEVFPNLDKLIFLGADTVINLDIGELWAYDLEGYGFAAVHEKAARSLVRIVQIHLVEHDNYFNSDVILLKPQYANRGKIILFILAGNYPQIRDFLTGQNFVEGTDFINGFMFLSERHGFKMNFDTRQIFREM